MAKRLRCSFTPENQANEPRRRNSSAQCHRARKVCEPRSPGTWKLRVYSPWMSDLRQVVAFKPKPAFGEMRQTGKRRERSAKCAAPSLRVDSMYPHPSPRRAPSFIAARSLGSRDYTARNVAAHQPRVGSRMLLSRIGSKLH